MKLLFVANRVPYPPFRGDKLKIYNLASRMCGQHELHLLTIAETRDDLSHKAELEKIFKSVQFVYLPKWMSVLNVFFGIFSKRPLQVSYFRSRKFRKLLSETISTGNFDAIHVQHLRMGAFFEDMDTTHAVLDLPDAFSLYWLRRRENAKNIWQKAFATLEYKRLLRYEKYLLRRFPLNLVCSPEDRAYLIEKTACEISVLPNGVDTGTFHPRDGVEFEHFRILFTGNMDYAPNIDAVEYFIADIWPNILKEVPQARFIIAGQRPVPKILALAAANVEVTGFVPNLADEYARAAVVIAPLRFGAGTQNKVLEALAMEIPVVCTSVGFKGLGIHSGEGAVLCSDPLDFAAEVVHILKDDGYRKQISEAGADTIRNKFSWDAVAATLEKILFSLK